MLFAPEATCVTTTAQVYMEMLERLVEQDYEIEELHAQLWATTSALEEALCGCMMGESA